MSHSSTSTNRRTALSRVALVTVAIAAAGFSGCAAQRGALSPQLEPAVYLQEAPATQQPQILTENHFTRDHAGSISEAALRQVLEAPVFLEENARVGVVPVQSSYAPDMEIPLTGVPAALADALDASGEFELTSEVSTDFPADRGISGLRELAARYRADYLLIYRHRFVDRSYLNPWAWGYATIAGAFFLPGNTIEAAGVLEATLFDVKTGTILFTVNERIAAEEQVNNWHNELKVQWLKRRMLETATQKLTDQVLGKVRRLVAARASVHRAPVARVLSSEATSTPMVSVNTTEPRVADIAAGDEVTP